MSETPSLSRGLRITLATSLGVNVLVLGLIAGAFLQNDGGPTRLAVTPDFRQSIDALPEAEQLALRQALRELAQERSGTRNDRIASMRAFTQALRQEPMDRETIQAIWAAREDQGDALRVAAQDLLLDTLENLPLSERMNFIEQLREQQNRRPRSGERDGRGDGAPRP